jgi:hypothetical protein
MNHQDEVWKPVTVCGDYEISNMGRIRRATPGKKTYVGKILKDQKVGSGYRAIRLTMSGKQYQFYIHRLVAIEFIGEVPNGYEVNHKDGDKTNNAVANLEYMTRSQNCIHAIETGLKVSLSGPDNPLWKGGKRPPKPPHSGERHWTKHKPECIASGERSGKNKVSFADVDAMRAAVASGAVQKRMAEKYGLSVAQVCRIINGRRWA